MFAPRNSSPVAMYGKEDVAAYEIKLKKVLGLTVCSNAALDCSPISGLLAYPAGQWAQLPNRVLKLAGIPGLPPHNLQLKV